MVVIAKSTTSLGYRQQPWLTSLTYVSYVSDSDDHLPQKGYCQFEVGAKRNFLERFPLDPFKLPANE